MVIVLNVMGVDLVKCFFCGKSLETKHLNIGGASNKYTRTVSDEGVLISVGYFNRWICNECNDELWVKTVRKMNRAKKSK